MTRIDALKALLEKVEAGEWDFRADAPARQVFPYQSSSADDLGLTARAAFEGSLDAAKALHEATLGDGYIWRGWKYRLWGHGLANVWDIISGDTFSAEVAAKEQHQVCVARAWLIAILKALISIEESKE